MSNAENLLQNKQLANHTKQQRLRQLLARPDIWRAANERGHRRNGIDSGYASLNALLSGHGWPRGATTELLIDRSGIGEISLLLPAVAEITRQGQIAILVNPPFIPYAPALANAGIQLEKLLLLHPRGWKEALWAMEQALQSGCCGALVSWQGHRPTSDKDLRRLQVAAREGDCLHFHFRPLSAAASPSPAGLRLQLGGDGEQLTVQLRKQLGGQAGQKLHLARSADLIRRDRPLH
ncbi:translesion DNA synthesis-associated protein ImuA [Microbulbifer thermotolerans]|uniref:SOS cell division inhibitor SulA n=1 Tax=Microbulbifer thermotolerans TaxID=252514 RepID=A0A143HKQ0_MICTH|nr:translesion DNA synthesis-associated protein ImuA [Microbulbifer thermotolerans]AMX02081.1 SOS cell division inhibitor SulA [Microbulbifer thermotolerans]MCX2781405.1 translesion DNA synthesis-associated protein ImuA [Microbulbifer thermotolerans]MCX2793854.1 translesion DNA synthesis-associated protein ImuA [Microbulbifer thermotolerans]MCX2830112.1 translesion DNA synthesis-associated protein ImuA [Microbulbifer thermotolerans]MCX2834318.1 translesion DNA synthesis-associated protein ImuA